LLAAAPSWWKFRLVHQGLTIPFPLSKYNHTLKVSEFARVVSSSSSILSKWRNHFSQLLPIHGVNGVTQTEIHTAELLVPEPSAFVVGMAMEKLKDTSSVTDQIPLEMITA